MNHLVGLFVDPATGMVGLCKEGGLSFMYPVPATDSLTYEHLGVCLQGRVVKHEQISTPCVNMYVLKNS